MSFTPLLKTKGFSVSPAYRIRTILNSILWSQIVRRHRSRPHQDAGGPVSQRAVGDVRVSGDPSDVCRTPVDVIRLVVKHQFEGGGGVEHVAADGVENPLQEERRPCDPSGPQTSK